MITFQQETFKSLRTELEPILPIHWKELGLDHEDCPLDPDFDMYQEHEDSGVLHICTARKDNALIGYFVTFIVPHIHYKSTIFGKVDVYYVHPDFRTNGVGAQLFRFHEQEMRRLGVKKLLNMCKVHQDHGPLFKALGYTHIEHIFSKLL